MTQVWRTRPAAFVISAISLVVGVASPVFAQSNFRLVELPSLTPAYDINDEGVVVGFYVFGDVNGNLGYKWTESTGTTPLISNPADINKFPRLASGELAINNAGTAVGQGSPSGGGAPFLPTVLSPLGAFTFLPPSETPNVSSTARSVNNAGAVVGLWRGNDQVGFYWTEASGVQVISPTPSDVFFARDAFDVNDAGIVVGWCTGSECGSSGSGYAWSPTAGHFVLPKVAGFDIHNHEAFAINERNQIVGRYGSIGVFFWSAATGTIDLGAPAGSPTALDINDRGDIVATITPPEGGSVAYLYRNGIWTNLNDLRQPGETFAIDTVRAINNNGWIAGSGNGPLMAGFVLIPPTVDVTVNGSDGPLTIGPGTPVQMSLAFDAGNATLNPGEVYAGIATPFGLYWKTPTGYTLTPTRLYAGPIPNFGPISLISVGPGLLPPGTYTWITIVDNDMNGVINAHYYDYVVTTVIP